ncbi:MAG: DUF2267 domain-containing protein [Pseudomonadota bacterium]
MTYSRNLKQEINLFQTWMNELQEKPDIRSADEAYAALRAVLQTLRDRLIPDEAAHLSAQLPIIARGIYYEGWDPSSAPHKYNMEEFHDKVCERLNGQCQRSDPDALTRHVFELLSKHVSSGEIDHVQCMLPVEMDELWPHLRAA